MLNEGLTDNVQLCPSCVTQKKEDRKIVGKLQFHVLEQLLDPVVMARYSRQIIRMECSEVED